MLPAWKEIIGIAISVENVDGRFDNESMIPDYNSGFICRKCLRAFESYKAAKEKLIRSASFAVKFMPTSVFSCDSVRLGKRSCEFLNV